MKKIFITGAGGFIGTKLVRILSDLDYEIIAYDRFFFGKELLPTSSKITTISGDSRDIDSALLADIDIVLDLASVCNDAISEYYQKETYEINFEARKNLCSLAKSSGVKRYILISSCAVYGIQEETCNEKTIPNPVSTYAKANILVEKAVIELQSPDFCVSVVRFATLLGWSPRMRFDLVLNNIIYDALYEKRILILNGGHQYRPFLYLDDAIDGIKTLIESSTKLINGEIFNIGENNYNFTLEEVAIKIKNIVYELGHPRPEIIKSNNGDERNYRVDFSKINQTLNWKPKYTIEQGIFKTIEDIQAYSVIRSTKHFTLDWYKMLEAKNLPSIKLKEDKNEKVHSP